MILSSAELAYLCMSAGLVPRYALPGVDPVAGEHSALDLGAAFESLWERGIATGQAANPGLTERALPLFRVICGAAQLTTVTRFADAGLHAVDYLRDGGIVMRHRFVGLSSVDADGQPMLISCDDCIGPVDPARALHELTLVDGAEAKREIEALIAVRDGAAPDDEPSDVDGLLDGGGVIWTLADLAFTEDEIEPIGTKLVVVDDPSAGYWLSVCVGDDLTEPRPASGEDTRTAVRRASGLLATEVGEIAAAR